MHIPGIREMQGTNVESSVVGSSGAPGQASNDHANIVKSSVCAIIVTYCIGKDLLRCFDSIENQVDEVVIVDNGADKETVSVLTGLEKVHHNVKIFYNRENLGIATAQNIGVKYAIDKGYTWVLTLDHDSEATPKMVEKLLNVYQTLSRQHVNNIGIIAANPFEMNIQEHLIPQKLFKGDCEVRQVDRVISSGSLINCHVFKQVGFFNESLFLYYVDDDFCLRCNNHQWKIYVCRSSVLLHREGNRELKKVLWRKCRLRNYGFHERYYISRNTIYMLRNYCKYRKFCYRITRRMCVDILKTILFDKNKSKLMCFTIKGVFDGIMGKYGKLVVSDNDR